MIPDIDVLIVGAGPTGLTLAAQLAQFGTRFRIIDRASDRAHESRALGVQARSLEILQRFGLGDALVARGNKSATVTLHVEGRVTPRFSLSDFGAEDTRYPFILFVSQAETERLLTQHLMANGVRVEREVELSEFAEDSSGVVCVLRDVSGRTERMHTRYLVGCDGAHSTVRKGANIAFEGDAYLQDFMLGDVEANAAPNVALASDSIHPFVGSQGIAIFFPLGHPASWRVIAMSARSAAQSRRIPSGDLRPESDELALEELQDAIDGASGGAVRAHSPAWMTHFRLHHRQAAEYRRGRVFIAGDAAHIHSPVGAQGMNTGIQDAWNLGWKLALVARGSAVERLLDSYHAERWPVGRVLLRYTDRAFSIIVRSLSPNALARWLRRTIPGRVVPLVLSSRRLRTAAFRFVSELDIRYRRSPAVLEATPKLRAGPRAGDRLPDASLTVGERKTTLHDEVVGARFHLLLCGAPDRWHLAPLRAAMLLDDGLVAVRYLTTHASANHLVDSDGRVMRLLGVKDAAQYLVRPDGYIAFRCAGRDLKGVTHYLRSWIRPVRLPAPQS
ncbi:MAG TPA: FAD-dependent monooxygenase [Gemmatimonadaceae bacterium]|jgi:2-polyprenyl-6-methoxyphenol hydroxylase-like FAD-dependent oxidoreductase|nr:FAD-dependent monooxygenase [Gemmatimonadaceae bacterium]